ncbi:MAG: 2-hydroxyhepta-2,4-diene-1,7-dioate isomerase [Bacteroidales bacterium]|nr:MAG: 2-hydroxyhepta-2,4-diene-1,7-dioate isomerase [Bacteroidales bacterium]
MKIICVGWNYHEHNNEMSMHDIPATPTIFLKPDSAILRENKPFFIPDFSSQIEYECELVYRINRIGRHISEKFAHRYYSEVGLGVDFTARDVQNRCRQLGEPWELAKAFDNSAVVGEFFSIDELAIDNPISFSLLKNGKTVQKATDKDMIFSIDKIIEYISKFFTLKIGDLIYTGTPSGIGQVQIGDHLQGFVGDRKAFDFFVR